MTEDKQPGKRTQVSKKDTSNATFGTFLSANRAESATDGEAYSESIECTTASPSPTENTTTRFQNTTRSSKGQVAHHAQATV
jgi:hypothetical protein